MRFLYTSFIIIFLYSFAFSGTTPYKVLGHWYYPMKSVRNFEQSGRASWYGKDFHGKKTANGETYNMHDMTAAHKTLPLGVYVEVFNLDNNRSCIVRVNDRGPFVKNRIIDLSYKAARILGVDGPGTANVHIKVKSDKKIYDPTDYKREYQKTYYTIQIASFRESGRAEKLKSDLNKRFKFARIKKTEYDGNDLYRVWVGRCKTLKKALEYEKIVVGMGYADAFAVSE